MLSVERLKKTILKMLSVFLLSCLIAVGPLNISVAHGSSVIRLKDLPINSIVIDDSWSIDHWNYSYDPYQGENWTLRKHAAVEWRKMHNNWYGSNEVTLMSNEHWAHTPSHGNYNFTTAPNYGMNHLYNNAQGDKSLFDENIRRVNGYIGGMHAYGHHDNTIGPLPKLYWIDPRESFAGSLPGGGTWWSRTNGGWGAGYYYSNGWTSWDVGMYRYYPVTNLHENTVVELISAGKYRLKLNRRPTITVTSPTNEELLNGSHINITGTVSDIDPHDTLSLYYTVSTFEFGKENFLKPVASHTDVLFDIKTANGTNQSFSGWIANNPVFPKGPLAITVYAEDDVGGRSDLATIYIANNNTTRYFYDKFNVVPTITNWTAATYNLYDNRLNYHNGTSWVTLDIPEYYSSYTHNKLTGQYELTGTTYSDPVIGGTVYTKITKGGQVYLLRIYRTTTQEYDDDDGSWYTINHYTMAELPTSIGRGSLHTSNVAAPELSLPNDGIHWDGFWYVKKGLANFTPVITLTNPTIVKYFGSGQDISISGTIQDADNDTVTISATINGVLKSTTIFNTSTAKTWTLTWLSSEVAQETFNNVVFNANDDYGGTSNATHTANIIVDKTNPNAPNIITNENWTNVASVPVTILHGTDSGGSGVNRMEYSLAGATTLGWTTYSASFNITNAGETTIVARTIDNAGNISSVSTRTVRMDRINPTGTIAGNVLDWTNLDITLTVSALDTGGSNVRRIRLPDSTWFDGASTNHIVTANGSYDFVIEDNAGNQITVTEVVDKIDKLSPLVDADNKEYDWKNIDIPIAITYQDDGGSGLVSSQFKITDTWDEPLDGWVDYSQPIAINSDGIFYLHYRSLDNAGNLTKGYFGPYQRDTVEPTITATPVTDQPTNENIEISLVFDGNGSSIVAKKWGVGVLDIYDIRNNGLDIDPSNLVTVSENGYYTFYARDEAGNEVIEVISVNAIDKIPPTVSANNLDYDWKNSDIAVELVFQDEGGSDLSATQYRVTTDSVTPIDWEDYVDDIVISTNGEYYIHYRAEDHAGNVTVGHFGPYKLDKELPTSPQISRNPDVDHNKEAYELTFESGIDSVSGINDIFYRLRGASVRDWTLYTGGIVEIENQGETVIEVKNTDVAGNESDITTTKVIVYGEAYDKVIEALDKAEDLIDIAKASQIQADVDNARAILDEARDLINLLPDSTDKTQLTDRLVDLEAELEVVQTIIDILDALDRIETDLDYGTENPNQNNVDAIRNLINDTQAKIDTLPDGALKDDLQSQLDEFKDILNELQETVTIITTLTMKLDNADLDFTVNPAELRLDPLELLQHYGIVITDLETNTVIVDTTATGTIQSETLQGHLYRVELGAHHDGELIVQRTFEKVKPDTTNPVIECAYILNNNLVVHASDNYRLHNTPYGFTLLDLGGTTVLSVETNAFNSVILVSNNNGTITNINFSADNNIALTPPKYVVVKVIDSFLNSSEVSFDVTKANEVLYGNVPQDIIEKIHLANNPPSSDDGGSGGVIPEVALPPSLADSLDNALGDKNISVNPLPTEVNSGTGGLIIDSEGYMDELKTVLSKNNFTGNVYYRIDVIEKGLNKLVYTNTVSDIKEIVIPGLADSTTYIVRISIVHEGERLAFKEIEKQTGDATPPIIEKITISDGTLQVFASDNMRLHEVAYQYQLQVGGATITFNPFGGEGIDGLEVASIDLASLIASNWNQKAWTSESRLAGLDSGARVKIIVRDHADNYTMTEVDVKGDGTFYDTVNGNNPLALKPNQSLDLEDILLDVLQQYNYQNPANAIDLQGVNLKDYDIRISDPSVGYMENGKLITKGNGKLIITFVDKKTGTMYKYSILISDALTFDRRIIIQTNSETNIKRAFEGVIEGEFNGQKVSLVNENQELGELDEETSIFTASDSEGLAKILLSNGRKEVPVYVIVVKDKFPESDVQLIKTKLAYVIKEGDRVDIKDISVFYNEYYNEANTDYLIIESANSSVKVDGNYIEAVEEGLAHVHVIDLVTQMIEVIDFRIISFDTQDSNSTDVEGHWAEEDIKELTAKGLLNEFNSEVYSPDEYVTRQEFLNAFSQLKVYLRDNVVERRNMLPLELGKEDSNYYSIMNALNRLSAFEVEYVLGKSPQFSKVMTRDEVAALLVMEFNLQAAADGSETFNDLSKTKYHNEILAVKEAGIMEGFDNTSFRPNKSLTRAEMATIFIRIIMVFEGHSNFLVN